MTGWEDCPSMVTTCVLVRMWPAVSRMMPVRSMESFRNAYDHQSEVPVNRYLAGASSCPRPEQVLSTALLRRRDLGHHRRDQVGDLDGQQYQEYGALTNGDPYRGESAPAR